MKNLFVSIAIAQHIKDLGFDEPCFAWTTPGESDFIISPCEKYGDRKDKMLQIPTYQQVKQWLWEKHKICFETPLVNFTEFGCGIYQWTDNGGGYYKKIHSLRPNSNFIESENEGVEKAVDHLYTLIKK